MKDLTKLADALKNQRQCDADGTDCIVSRQAADEAAAILRSAAVVDVDKFMEMVTDIASKGWSAGLSAGTYDRAGERAADAEVKETCEQLASALRLALAARPSLSVWYGSMPESNGRTNWTATLRNGDLHNGFTFARSQYPHRVRYAADEVRHLIGELTKRPSILDYDADEQTPCHLCGGTGEVDGKPCWGLNFEGTVHRAAAAPKGTT